jgi:hypothetical protein
MKRSICSPLWRCLALATLSLALPCSPVRAQEKTTVPAGSGVNVTVVAGTVPPPPVSITLYDRHGHVTPIKGKCTHTGGGLTDVATPTPDVVVITMSGAVVANASMAFDFEQCFEVSFDDPKVKKAKLTLEGRVIGLLRGEKKGCAEYTDACASIGCGPGDLTTVCVPPHSACECNSLAVNDHDGPRTVPVLPGRYTLHQTFNISAHTDSYLHKRPSAEFAPDPALDPLWITYFDPFHGVKKDTFGFQVIVKVAADTDPGDGEKKADVVPPPREKPASPARTASSIGRMPFVGK